MSDDFILFEIFLPRPAHFKGILSEGHQCPRYLNKRSTDEIVDLARQVHKVGGRFYLDGQKFKYVVRPDGIDLIMVDGWDEARQLRRAFEAAHV